jgi:hypothetical protein
LLSKIVRQQDFSHKPPKLADITVEQFARRWSNSVEDKSRAIIEKEMTARNVAKPCFGLHGRPG